MLLWLIVNSLEFLFQTRDRFCETITGLEFFVEWCHSQSWKKRGSPVHWFWMPKDFPVITFYEEWKKITDLIFRVTRLMHDILRNFILSTILASLVVSVNPVKTKINNDDLHFPFHIIDQLEGLPSHNTTKVAEIQFPWFWGPLRPIN